MVKNAPFPLIGQRPNRFQPRHPSRRLFDRIAGVGRLVRVALVSGRGTKG
jgi:hypothetical protein